MSHSRQNMVSVLGKKTMQISDPKQLANEIASFLIDERLGDSCESIMRDVMQYRADHGLVEATAVSAYPLNAQVLSDVESIIYEQYPNASSVIINQKVDTTLIGGVRIDLPNQQLDLSTRAQLNKFKRLTGFGKE